MNIYCIVLFICAQTFCTNAFVFFGKKNHLDFKALEQAVLNKCVNVDNSQQFEKIFSDFDLCKSRALKDFSITFDNYENNQGYCTFLKESEFSVCWKNLTTNISPCFTEKKIDIQKFLLNAFDTGYEQLCGINGASNTEYLYHKINGSQECLQINAYLFFVYGSCTGKLNAFKNLDEGLLNLSKQDICHDLKSLQKCTTQVMEGICGEEFFRFTELIFRPFVQNCNNLNNTIENDV